MTHVHERVRKGDQARRAASRDPYQTEAPKPRGAGFAPVLFIVILLAAASYFLYNQNATVNMGPVAPAEQT